MAEEKKDAKVWDKKAWLAKKAAAAQKVGDKNPK